MKIAAPTFKGGLSDEISEQFGRAESFTIVEVEDGEIRSVEVVKNRAAEKLSGAGVSAAQFVVDEGVDVLLAGNIGPKAYSILRAAGIKVYRASGLKVSDAVERYLKSELDEITEPSPKKGRKRRW